MTRMQTWVRVAVSGPGAGVWWLIAGVAFIASGCSSEQPFIPPGVSQGSGGLATETGGMLVSTGGQPLTGGQGAATGGELSELTTGGVVAATGGAQSGTGGQSGENGVGTWCAARDAFHDKCLVCHAAEPVGAPMPLVTYEDTQATSLLTSDKLVHQAIAERIHDSARPMPPTGSEPLSAEQMTDIDAWLAAGAPDGECGPPKTEGEPPMAEFEWPADCEETYEIRVGDAGNGPYRVGAGVEENRDFTIPVPWRGPGPIQALAIRPISENKRVVHHWILYAGALEFITSWSPGKPPETFSDDVGVYMPASGTFRLNMHYYNVGNNQAEMDNSGLEVCITRNPRPNTATTYMFSAAATVAPNQRTENVRECTVSALNGPVHLITSSPHMHSYGVHAKFEIIRRDGTVEMLDDTPFNWENQNITKIEAVVNTGDKIRTTCIYQNDTSSTIRFGSSSADEMCFNFARYYPKGGLSCR